MADQDEDSKTEEPTGKRLADARQRGQVPSSREVPTWILLAATGAILMLAGPNIAAGFRDSLSSYLRSAHEISFSLDDIGAVLVGTLFDSLLLLGPVLVIFFILAAASFIIQNGWLISGEPIKPKLSKISPLAGAKRYLQAKMYVEFAKNLLKISIVAAVGLIIFAPEFNRLTILPRLSTEDHLYEILHVFMRILVGVLAVYFVIMIFDVLFQRMQHRKQLRMTKQEVKEEFKNAEGDPHVKARLRQIRTKRAMNRMMQAVPEADVVVTNPTHFACALAYKPDQGMEAPILIAKGQDLVALKIRELATENDITIVENPPLARALFATCEIDQEVPEEHYRAVAEVISYVWNLRGRNIN